MGDPDQQVVITWIDAYYSHRDAEMLALAHPEIEIRPRAGQGERVYTGHDGVERWLADTTANRSRILEFSTGTLPDGRVLAEAELDGTPVVGIFELEEHLIRRISMLVSDREMLQRIRAIPGAPGDVSTQAVTGALEPEPAAE